jgi:hypothetical protein
MGMFYDSHENFSAAGWLGTVADSMRNDFLNYWEQQNVSSKSELSEEQRNTIGLFIRMADTLRPLVHSLSVGDKAVASIEAVFRDLGGRQPLKPQQAVSFAQVLSVHPVINHSIQIELATEAAEDLLNGAERRFAELLELVEDRSLNPRTTAYLDRATRLYLWGFEPETIVMSAAAVEAAYESRFSDLDMFALQIKKDGKRFEPWQYERAAATSGVYQQSDRDLAYDLREARNDTVHNVPAVALSGLAAIRSAAHLLNKLFPPSAV